MNTLITPNLTASSPSYRRRSSIYIDGIHDVKDDNASMMAPAQLYSTMSGRLFHCGRIAIVLVGLPARGKTHISVSLSRYLQWLGVKTRVFHLGDYRRATLGENQDVPEDYFYIDPSPSSLNLRDKIVKKCREDLYTWLNNENGQVAIYDAVNPHSEGRRSLALEFAKNEVQTIFIESYVTDRSILAENARSVKINSPDFKGMNADEAAQLYLRRIDMKIPHFQTMNENDLNYIKMINAGQSIQYNNVSFGYLSYRIVFYLMNLHIKSRAIFFARAGASDDENSYKSDDSLGDDGVNYSQKMTNTLLAYIKNQNAQDSKSENSTEKLLTVWTSDSKNSYETAIPLEEEGFKVRQRSQLSQINPGVCENLNESSIRKLYPDEIEKHEADPYHHRYPRAESYHDLAVRLEPIILELEREENDLLIIAHESVLRVLYGYLMACDAMLIPALYFPRDQIIEKIVPSSYQNEARIIKIPDLKSNDISNDTIPAPIPIILCPAGNDSPAELSNQSINSHTEEHPLSLD
ncbi:unnamed protein product [Blumeria hordei]|uniref:6-phosphofructo-2-kinase domain-containing protein n=1 Tax=Blumeria hordei TaxID=2867405 RepID=A0A383UN29_BLUHO|nr:unnamed protein product [Blumeria hordei]